MEPSLPSPIRHPPSAIARWTIRFLAFVALALSAFLLYESLGTSRAIPGCGAASGCSSVLHSRWSAWLGIPVSAAGVVIYAIAFAASLHLNAPSSRRQHLAWRVLLFASVAAGSAAVYFIVLQGVVVGALCKYCMTIHACGLLMLALVLWHGKTILTLKAHPLRGWVLPGAAALGLLPTIALIAGQLLTPPPAARVDLRFGIARDTGPGPHRVLMLFVGSSGRVTLQPHELPMLGSPDAKMLVIVLADYTCPHCRALHQQLLAARQHLGEKLGVIVLPVPLDASCNPAVANTPPEHVGACELAKLALAVWKENPKQFEAYDRWLFASEMPRTVAAARTRAAQLLGSPDTLKAALADPWVASQIARNVVLFRLAGAGLLPQLIVGRTRILGEPPNAAALMKLLEEGAKGPRGPGAK